MSATLQRSRAFLPSSAALSLAFFATGCSIARQDLQNLQGLVPVSSSVTIQGKVHGGSKAISGAHVYLFAASTQGYGQPSLSLLQPGTGVLADATGNYVLTAPDGSFSLSGDYSCTPGTQLYLYAAGGNPGLAPGTTNPALSMLSVLGACPAAGALPAAPPSVSLNEISTVATAYALAGFMSSPTAVSASSSTSAKTGLANAFRLPGNLLDLATGTALTSTPSGNGSVPSAQLDTLASILAACVDSDGTASACSNLFAAAAADGATPADTASAILNIAHHPATSVAALFALTPTSGAAFQPVLTSSPADWTLAIRYTAPNLSQPSFPVLDAAGDLWTASASSNSLTELDPTGTLLSGTAGFTGGGLQAPSALAVDSTGNIWVSNAASLSEFSSTGQPLSPATGFTGGGLTSPTALAADSTQEIWAANATSALAAFSASATPVTSVSLPTPQGDQLALAIDSHHNLWVADLTNPGVFGVDSSGKPITPTQGLTGGGMQVLNGLVIDARNNLWLDNLYADSLVEFSPTGAPLSPATGFTGGGLNNPAGLAVDGSGSIWVANQNGGSLSLFAADGTALSPSSGLQPAGITFPYGIAVDASGNVWATQTDNTILQVIGAATPVVTPLSPTQLGIRP